jgi:hypothetical protein
MVGKNGVSIREYKLYTLLARVNVKKGVIRWVKL